MVRNSASLNTYGPYRELIEKIKVPPTRGRQPKNPPTVRMERRTYRPRTISEPHKLEMGSRSAMRYPNASKISLSNMVKSTAPKLIITPKKQMLMIEGPKYTAPLMSPPQLPHPFPFLKKLPSLPIMMPRPWEQKPQQLLLTAPPVPLKKIRRRSSDAITRANEKKMATSERKMREKIERESAREMKKAMRPPKPIRRRYKTRSPATETTIQKREIKKIVTRTNNLAKKAHLKESQKLMRESRKFMTQTKREMAKGFSRDEKDAKKEFAKRAREAKKELAKREKVVKEKVVRSVKKSKEKVDKIIKEKVKKIAKEKVKDSATYLEKIKNRAKEAYYDYKDEVESFIDMLKINKESGESHYIKIYKKEKHKLPEKKKKLEGLKIEYSKASKKYHEIADK